MRPLIGARLNVSNTKIRRARYVYLHRTRGTNTWIQHRTKLLGLAWPPLYPVLIKVMSSFYILLQLTGHAVRVSEAILSELS